MLIFKPRDIEYVLDVEIDTTIGLSIKDSIPLLIKDCALVHGPCDEDGHSDDTEVEWDIIEFNADIIINGVDYKKGTVFYDFNGNDAIDNDSTGVLRRIYDYYVDDIAEYCDNYFTELFGVEKTVDEEAAEEYLAQYKAQESKHPSCSVCEGNEHHWMPNTNIEDESDIESLPSYICKHCDATTNEIDDGIENHILITPEQYLIYCEISKERYNQDAQWGGPEHDDQHSIGEWYSFIYNQYVAMMHNQREQTLTESRERLIKIAALAMAAIESIDRKSIVNECC